MATDYVIVAYEERFKAQVAELQTHLWGPDRATNVAHLEWKYERNPYMSRPLIHLALHGDRVVGMRGYYGARWEVGSPATPFSGPCAGDLVVAPDHRNRGVVAKIMAAAADGLADRGYAYSFNLSAGLATQLGSLRAGWRSVGPIELARWQPMSGALERRVRASSVWRKLPAPVRREVRRLAIRRLQSRWTGGQIPFSRLDSNAGRIGDRSGGRVTLERTPRPEAMAELVARLGSDGRIRHVRDPEYFAWRFGNPLSTYRFLFWTGARLEGYLILQARVSWGTNNANILDWEATCTRVRSELLDAAIHHGRFQSLTTWSGSLSDDAKGLLQQAGFSTAARPPSLGRSYREMASRPMLLVRAVTPNPAAVGELVIGDRRLTDLADWDLRGLYSDTH